MKASATARLLLLPGELLHIDLADGVVTSLPNPASVLPAPCVSPFFWGLT